MKIFSQFFTLKSIGLVKQEKRDVFLSIQIISLNDFWKIFLTFWIAE